MKSGVWSVECGVQCSTGKYFVQTLGHKEVLGSTLCTHFNTK